MIVKVQLSLNHPKREALIYDRERTVWVQVEASSEVIDICRRDKRWGGVKTYVNAEITSKGFLVLGETVEGIEF